MGSAEVIEDRTCPRPCGAVHGRSGGDQAQPAHQSAVRTAAGARQSQDGGAGRSHAQAGSFALWGIENPTAVSAGLRQNPLTTKTVST